MAPSPLSQQSRILAPRTSRTELGVTAGHFRVTQYALAHYVTRFNEICQYSGETQGAWTSNQSPLIFSFCFVFFKREGKNCGCFILVKDCVALRGFRASAEGIARAGGANLPAV